jgi:hypothetical protein
LFKAVQRFPPNLIPDFARIDRVPTVVSRTVLDEFDQFISLSQIRQYGSDEIQILSL